MLSLEAEPRAAEALDTTPPVIDISALTVEFPTLSGRSSTAIRELDLSIARGEIFGLVGESGAGKTTLARSLLGLPPAPGRVAAGEIRFEGQDLLRIGERALRRMRGRDLSMIVPNPRSELNPLLPVGEQIMTVARVHLGVPRREARRLALDMLRAVQIPDPERRMAALPHELSGGMAQRIVIAIALVCSPRFIVSDDATSGLDVTVQAQILELLQRLAADRGSAMLFITRDIGITAHLCDRIAVMLNGEIMELAAREDFFFRPRNPYTITLMAAFAHNEGLRRLWTRSAPPLEPAAAGRACPFLARCPLAQPRCAAERPALRELAPGHVSRCHFPVPR
ncbi:ABC transporter ATP-binding protein [Paracraurococcus lichenis]|uniref:ABC transporter ATP-binding protein n=1 Tax=Paracraurococcus lichenis TaxID=3064888 RepID=A0ABT9E2L2_9PROT|nr:ABC transporter ATP-binding protein [Paracraurococcus sp. LOR1-02]MDO9710402.1 ABC transporter ATP-binding protein [Paracraurococcus sp. LOR1-02]